MSVCPDVLYRHLLDDLRSELGESRLNLFLSLDKPPPDLTPREWSCWSILKSFLKKFEVENTELLDNKALLKFLEVNYACKNWSLQLSDTWDEVLWGELKALLWNFFHVEGLPIFDSLTDFLRNGRVGPGAAISARGGDFYTKMYDSPLSCTSRGLYIAYRDYISNFPEFSNAEFIRQENHGSVHIVEGNRLSFVPKNDKISRTICIEPGLNMFIQLGAGHILERQLLSAYGISLADQPFKNRELARRGSIFGDTVTCDLSSASDSMSLKMLESCLPRHAFGMLKMLRSRSSEVPRLGRVELHMVSTMGNGFTFPLQTVLFSSIVNAAARARGFKLYHPRGRDQGNWGVFGDDIICPREIWGDVKRLLRLTGFVINNEKTFVEGPFRESCGGDFLNGVNIRGVYVKRLSTQQDLCSVVNQLNLFSTRTGLKLSSVVQKLISHMRWLPVPRWENDSSGIKVPLSLVSKELPVSTEYCGSHLYRRYEPVGQKIRILEGRIKVPLRAKLRAYNPSGLLMAFLQGSINSFSIGVRHDSVRYRRKLGVSPFWDATPTVHPLSGWFPWQRWNTAVYLNLFG